MSKVISLEQFRKKGNKEEPQIDKKENDTDQFSKEKENSRIPDKDFGNYIFCMLMKKKFSDERMIDDRIKRVFNSTLDFNPNVLRQMREKVKEYSAKELALWLADSSESDWLKYPAFYHAVAEEADLRIRSALATLRKK